MATIRSMVLTSSAAMIYEGRPKPSSLSSCSSSGDCSVATMKLLWSRYCCSNGAYSCYRMMLLKKSMVEKREKCLQDPGAVHGTGEIKEKTDRYVIAAAPTLYHF